MNRLSARWRKWLPWLLVLAWYGVIFWFSAQPGDISDVQSARVERIAHAETVLFIPVRKWAHMTLFAVQGALCCNALAGEALRGGGLRCRRDVLRVLCVVLGICAVLGGLDEMHQLFISERAAMIEDVGFDVLGSLLGTLGYLGIGWLLVRFRPANTKGNPS